MNLDMSFFEFLKRDEIRALTAIEMGMRNHDFVPTRLIEKLARLKRSNIYKTLQVLLKHKLITHTQLNYDGYKLNFSGYDYLAMNSFVKAGHISSIEMQVGVGKESDIYLVRSADNKLMVLKLARLGRTSFKTIKKNRDYIGDRTQFNWLYLSRLASFKEFKFMEALYKHKFPVPVPVANNRHAILMSFINGFPLHKVKSIVKPEIGYNTLMDIIERFASYGLIHSDFNEFNIMIDNEQKIWVIDFPQMVSTSHQQAEFFFERDVKCINDLFRRKFGFECDREVSLKGIKLVHNLDAEIKASGFKNDKNMSLLENYLNDAPEEEYNDNTNEYYLNDVENDGKEVNEQNIKLDLGDEVGMVERRPESSEEEDLEESDQEDDQTEKKKKRKKKKKKTQAEVMKNVLKYSGKPKKRLKMNKNKPKEKAKLTKNIYIGA